MNVLTITGIVVVLTLLFGALLAALFRGASSAVSTAQEEMERERAGRRPHQTQGHPLPVDAGFDVQLKEARKLAAKRAARLPRWGNFHIQGRDEVVKAPSAFKGLERDPITAVKIAQFHTWAGLATVGQTVAQDAPHGTVATAPAAPAKSADDLEPGVDYPVIEITDDMDPAEVRKARVANAKARSAAVKALKEAPAARAASPAPALTAAPAAGAATEPQPGVDYEVIEITDDMDPAEVRKARIANSKARSAAMKAFKERGGAATPAPPVPAPAAAAAAPSAAVAATTGEPQPGVDYEFIEITDGMSPDEVRKARIANAKARSAAMKAFKAAGGTPEAAAPATPAQAPAPEPQAVATPLPPAGAPPPPDYIEISDDMDPADVRKARIANAKMRSAYAKALKEAGIDPSTVL
jgi:putative ubiquitin-RnfH superfamily antitoxin RatB of RatAB toxin-antitoxin module